MSESTTLLDGRQPSRPLPAPHVPLVRLDGVDYPLAVAGRNDPRLLRALADAYPAATVVEFALDSLLELAPAYANRIADGLVEVFGNWDRPEDLRELFQSLLGMAPGVDMLRCLVWRHAVEGAAVGQVMRFGDVNACARAIAARARELGIEGCQAHRVRDRITAGARGKICPLPHEAFAAGTPPT